MLKELRVSEAARRSRLRRAHIPPWLASIPRLAACVLTAGAFLTAPAAWWEASTRLGELQQVHTASSHGNGD